MNGTFYFDTGKNFNEEEIYRFYHEHETVSFSIEVELPKNTTAVRFDPVEGYCCFLTNLVVLSDTNIPLNYQVLNGIEVKNNGISFSITDPQILITIKDKINIIKLSCYIFIFSSLNEITYLQTRIEQLHQLIERLRLHIDLTKAKEYYSCNYLERINLYFESYDTEIKRFVRFCCGTPENIPESSFCGNSQETINSILNIHTNTIAESKMFSLLGETSVYDTKKYTKACAKCDIFQLRKWKGSDGLIHLISFNMWPSLCQCRCIYCNNYKLSNNHLHLQNFEKILDIIIHFKNNDMIADDIIWQMASGEITIHPFKDQIYNLVGTQTAQFFTNCFIYDINISKNLATNPKSIINLSIDSGTPQTWKKVKGVDNFNTILDTLQKYSSNCITPEQIYFKYIILPGINDSLEDYRYVVELMKNLKLTELHISCDLRERYTRDNDKSKLLSTATGYLLAILKKNKISYVIYPVHYSPDEIKNSLAFADELLNSGII